MFPVMGASRPSSTTRPGGRAPRGGDSDAAAVRDLVAVDGGGFDLDGERFDKVIVATNGSPKREGWRGWALGTPSSIRAVPVHVQHAGRIRDRSWARSCRSARPHRTPSWCKTVRIDHPLGHERPGRAKLSAWGARDAAERNYHFTVKSIGSASPTNPRWPKSWTTPWPRCATKRWPTPVRLNCPRSFGPTWGDRVWNGCRWHELGKRREQARQRAAQRRRARQDHVKEEFVVGASPSAGRLQHGEAA